MLSTGLSAVGARACTVVEAISIFWGSTATCSPRLTATLKKTAILDFTRLRQCKGVCFSQSYTHADIKLSETLWGGFRLAPTLHFAADARVIGFVYLRVCSTMSNAKTSRLHVTTFR
jgi:hypothetical protein